METFKRILRYWRYLFAFVLLLGVMFLSEGRSDAVEEAERELNQYEKQLEDLHIEIDRTGLSAEQRQNEIDRLKRANELTADVAEQVKDIQLLFRDHYHDEDKEVSDEALEQAKNIWYGYTESDLFAFSWVQEPGWDIRVETTTVYSDDKEVPIVWSLWREDGELAGFVRGMFNIEKSTIDFNWKYTYRGYYGDPEPDEDENSEINIKSFEEVFENGEIE